MLTRVRVLLARIAGQLGSGSRDDTLAAEMRAHLDALEDEHVARGLSRQEARLAARKAFGGVEQVRAAYRDQQRLPFVDALWQDIRFGWRVLARDKGFALTAVLVLGLGIGINSMQVAVFDAHLLRGLPIPQPDRVLYISTFDDRQPDRGVSCHDLQDLRQSVTTFSGLAAYTVGAVVVGDEGRAPERRDGARISANAFDQLRIQPALGRGFLPDEDREGAAPVALISEALWKSRYGGDAALIGLTILIDGVPTTIVGVMADHSGFPGVAEVFRPLGQTPGLAAQGRDVRTLRVFGRLAEGVDAAQARAEVENITVLLAREHAVTSAGNRARVVPINERLLGRLQPQWLAFLAVGFLVAAISAANVANLMLAHAMRRGREMAVRTSVGATRGRILRQLFTESAVLAALGGLAGLAVASLGLWAFQRAVPVGLLPYWFRYEMDLRAFAALMAITAAVLLIFGLLPSLYASRTDVNRMLKDSAVAGVRVAARRWTSAFLTAELALAVVMLANLVLAARTSSSTVPTDRAVDTESVLTAAVALPAERYPSPADRLRFFERLQDQLGTLPGVAAASIASHLPVAGAAERRLVIDGRPSMNADTPQVWSVAIGSSFLETLGLGVVRGRAFSDEDAQPGRLNAVVNERLAELFFPDEDPIGRRIALVAPNTPDGTAEWLTIVGVAPTIRRFALPDITEPIAYTPLSLAPPAQAALLVRSDLEATSLAPLVRQTVASLDSALPVSRVLTMAQVVYDTAWSRRVGNVLLSLFTIIAATLAGVGVYAVTAYTVGLRTREIGVRLALGATRRQVWSLVVGGGLRTLGVALALGVLGAFAWERAFETGQREGIGLTSPGSLLLVAGALAGLTLCACLAPARRATRLNLVTALRQE
jgi:putative ABC transport system permease protein